MPIGDAASRAGEMLGGLKDRLGFSRKDDKYDNYDDYNDYDDGYADDYDDGYDDYGYDDYRDSGTSASAAGGYKPATTRSNRFGRADSTPDLVSIDDVKEHTRVPGSLLRDPLSDRGGSRGGDRMNARDAARDSSTGMGPTFTTRRGGRDLVQNSGPAESSPAYNARVREASNRSEGLNSLFEPTRGSKAYDPYEAYSTNSSASYSSSRGVTVIKPVAYSDVERVARAVKAGDVVVLAMRNTPDDLSKRVLDFSFGVASALDANVESPGGKVFAIARGRGLTEEEKTSLRNQGVL